MNVAHLLHDRALETPDRAAIVDRTGAGGRTRASDGWRTRARDGRRIRTREESRTLSFAELDSAAARAATAFLEAGLVPGDRVVVVHPMSAELYIGIAGLLRAGCVPTVCDPGARRAEIDFACKRIAPRAIFGSFAGLVWALSIPPLARLHRRFACAVIPGVIDIRAPRELAPIAPRGADDAAIVSFTSGSTGTPKIVVRSHALLRAVLAATREVAPARGVDVATMPIVLLANLAAGVTSVIPGIDLRRPGRADADRLADDIAATAATSIVASPALLERLIRLELGSRLRTLETIVTGGAPVLPALIDGLARSVPHAAVIAVYGSTEAEPIAQLPAGEIEIADRHAMRAGAGVLAGLPVRSATVRIIRSELRNALTLGEPRNALAGIASLTPGVVGEIVVAGEHVVSGYLDGRGDAETKIRAGDRVWHRTGDLGYFDERERLWLCGRAAAAIHDTHGALNPLAVECALSFDSTIARSALAAVGGRRIVAIEPHRNAAIDTARVRAALAWTTIDEVCLMRIPVDRRHNAKVDYRALTGRLGTHHFRIQLGLPQKPLCCKGSPVATGPAVAISLPSLELQAGAMESQS